MVHFTSYHQALAQYFDQRSATYDQGEFHPQLAHLLVQSAQITSGQKVLDLATGTGLVAIEVAQMVGETGQVIGVDLSAGMLQQGEQKKQELNLTNLSFQQGDGESLSFPHASFDRILCCSALPYFKNVAQALQRWRQWLKTDGLLGISGFSTQAFIAGILIREILNGYGIALPQWNRATATPEQCHQLLVKAGFPQVEIYTEQLGGYLSLAEAQQVWDIILRNPLCQGIESLSAQSYKQAQQEYFQALQKLLTPQGIWNDTTTFLIIGRLA